MEPSSMRTGLRTCDSTSFLTDDSIVAEKNMRLARGRDDAT